MTAAQDILEGLVGSSTTAVNPMAGRAIWTGQQRAVATVGKSCSRARAICVALDPGDISSAGSPQLNLFAHCQRGHRRMEPCTSTQPIPPIWRESVHLRSVVRSNTRRQPLFLPPGGRRCPESSWRRGFVTPVHKHCRASSMHASENLPLPVSFAGSPRPSPLLTFFAPGDEVVTWACLPGAASDTGPRFTQDTECSSAAARPHPTRCSAEERLRSVSTQARTDSQRLFRRRTTTAHRCSGALPAGTSSSGACGRWRLPM